jgi:Zn-dependent protease with chaperone function
MTTVPAVDAEDFRVDGEQSVLFVSLAITAVVLVALAIASMGLVVLITLASIAYLRMQQGQLLGRCVRVSEQQLPEIHRIARVVAERLSMAMPAVYVQQSPVLNAYAMGFLTMEKSVVVHSALVEALTEDELMSVIGHEFGHIKCGHTTWTVITGSAGQVSVPVISKIMSLVMLNWSRKAEYTSDRAGILACRKLQPSITAEAKLAIGKQLFDRLNLESLMRQKSDVDQDDISRLSEIMLTHPYAVNRIHAMKAFFDGDVYRRLTSSDPGVPGAAGRKFCAHCGAEELPGSVFCTGCGQRVAAVQH